MAKLTPLEFQAKYYRLFADNEIQNITEATFREWTLDMTDSFAGQDKGPNDTVGGLKLVIYQTKEEAVRAGRPKNATLDQLTPNTIVCGNLARIDITPTGPAWLEAVYDDGQGPYPFGAGFFGVLDGSGQLHKAQLPASGGLAALKWVLKDSPEARAANVPLYKAGTNYRINDLVRALFGTFPDVKSVVFYSNESGNDIPAPSRLEGDAYWSVFNPTPAPYFPWQTVTPDELRQLKAAGKYTAGRLYIVSPRPIPFDFEDRTNPDVFVRALTGNELEPTGWLLVGTDNKVLVNYDLATDTTTAVESASTFAQVQGPARSNLSLAAELRALDPAPFELRFQADSGPQRLRFDNLRDACALVPTDRPATILVWPGQTDLGNGEKGHLIASGDTGAFNRNLTIWLAGGTILKVPSGSQLCPNGWQAFTSPGGSLTVTGPGKLIGRISLFGCNNLSTITINCRHEGYIYVNYYALSGKATPDIITIGSAAYATNTQNAEPYLVLFTGNGGFYGGNAVSIYLDRCRLEAAAGLVRIAGTGNGDVRSLTIANAVIQPAVAGDVAGIPTSYLSATPAAGGAGGGTGGVTAAQLEQVRTTAKTSAVQAGDYVLTLADAGGVVPFAAAATCTVPADVFAVGTLLEISQEGASAVTLAGAAGVTLRTSGGLKTAGQWASIGLRQRAANEWVVTSAVS